MPMGHALAIQETIGRGRGVVRDPAVLWPFDAEQAHHAAERVLNHKPDEQWTALPMPISVQAARVAVETLAASLAQLAPSLLGVFEASGRSASQLSDDPLQGLGELIQNADDAAARNASLQLTLDNKLVFAHDGGALTLPDVWALAIPWLSEKANDADSLGRFGVGLKTLQALSTTLDVHHGPFHVRFGSSDLTPIEALTSPSPPWATTTFHVPLPPGRLNLTALGQWLTDWGDAGLLFLRHLDTIELLDPTGSTVEELHLTRTTPTPVTRQDHPLTRSTATARDGRCWWVYEANVDSPESSRAGKADAGHTRIAIAVPRFADPGYLHVGLPVCPIGLPFRIAAQFDPLANRRGISPTPWSLALIDQVADLWVRASLDLFDVDPADAWRAIPLQAELDADTHTSDSVRERFATSLLVRARRIWAETLRLSINGARFPLTEVGYESVDLTAILSPHDTARLAERPAALPMNQRDPDARWRQVFAELPAIDAPTPVKGRHSKRCRSAARRRPRRRLLGRSAGRPGHLRPGSRPTREGLAKRARSEPVTAPDHW